MDPGGRAIQIRASIWYSAWVTSTAIAVVAAMQAAPREQAFHDAHGRSILMEDCATWPPAGVLPGGVAHQPVQIAAVEETEIRVLPGQVFEQMAVPFHEARQDYLGREAVIPFGRAERGPAARRRGSRTA